MTSMKRFLRTGLFVAAPIAFLVIETAGHKFP